MKAQLVRCGLVAGLSIATMGMGTCATTGGVINTGGMSMPSASMTAAELQLAMDALAAINAHRATKSLAPLTWYAAGAQVAYTHNLAMEAGGFFAHVDPNTGNDPATRALNAGIMHDPQGAIDPTSGNPFVGENLFNTTAANPTGADAVNAWITSPGHHTQIDAPLPVTGAQTMPPWTHCGIGVRTGSGQSWFTAMFFRNPN